jgi:hypothetical protein
VHSGEGSGVEIDERPADVEDVLQACQEAPLACVFAFAFVKEGRVAEDMDGVRFVDEDPDVVVVNTCGFVESAKKDSIDTLLAIAQARELIEQIATKP